ncbi:MAG: tetratricopeptide repeat protein, partial [Candidatus Aminicenantes bacterium]|nr:tetratricopeptide repeat protein [Candidatus Aminicenantes bacterium]
MKKRSIEIVILIIFLGVCLSIAGMSQKTEDPGVMLRSAIEKEEVDGNLQGAIELYQQIIEKFGGNQAIAAQAQLRIGLCHEKLGQKSIKQAQDAFQKVIDNYPSQSEEVRIAKERLSLLLKAQVVTKKDRKELRIRKIYDGKEVDVIGEISSDGQYISFPDWGTGGRLATYEIATGKKRILKIKGGYAMALASTWSPDNKQVAYIWYNEGMFWDLRIIGLSDSESRVLYKDEKAFVYPTDWSPDGKFISAFLSFGNPQLSQIGQVAIADGSFSILKTVDHYITGGGGHMKYSPDGRYLAYDLSPKGKSEREIFSLSSDGKNESSLVQHPADDYLLSWTPDGKNILFVSDRMGTQDLWIVATEEGKPQGTPSRIKPNIGNIYPLGFTRNGQFYYGIRKGLRDIYLAEVDLDKGTVLTPPAKGIKRHLGTATSPEWSPDGKFMAYVTSNDRGMISLRILSLETGKEREVLRPDLQGIANVSQGLHWSPDGRSLLTIGYDHETQQDAYIIDVETAKMTALNLEMLGERLVDPAWSNDGKTIFYMDKSWKKQTFRIMAFDIENKQSKELAIDPGNPLWLDISPDGQLLAYKTVDSKTKSSVIKALSVDGGEPRNVAEIKKGCYALNWTPDGKSLLYFCVSETESTTDKKSEKVAELWKVSVDGK